MITKINGVRIPPDDPVHHLTGAALEQRVDILARTVEEARLRVARDYMRRIQNAYPDSIPKAPWTSHARYDEPVFYPVYKIRSPED